MGKCMARPTLKQHNQIEKVCSQRSFHMFLNITVIGMAIEALGICVDTLGKFPAVPEMKTWHTPTTTQAVCPSHVKM